MQYIYIRDYKAGSTRNIPLQVWPMSMGMAEFNKMKVNEEAAIRESVSFSKQGSYCVVIGTKDGKTLVYQVTTSTSYATKLYSTRPGVAYGAITAVDVQPTGEYMVAATESGEIL